MTLTERRCLWAAILGTLLLQLTLTGFFAFGKTVPLTIDTHVGNYQQSSFHFPPRGDFNTDYWLGLPQPPNGLHPLSLFSHLPFWIFATTFYPLCAAFSLYFTFLLFKQWGFNTYSSIFAGVIFAWQGSFLSNLLPAHFSPAALFALFPLTFYGAVRAQSERSLLFWAWTGVGSGMMILFLPDQGFLANLLIGIYLLFAFAVQKSKKTSPASNGIRALLFGIVIWGVVTFLISLPGLESVVLQNMKGIHQGTAESPEKQYDWATQWSFTPEEVIQYIVPGFLGWHNLSQEGPYWGRIGQSSDWNGKDQGMRNYMLGINTLGTVSALLAAIGLASFFKPYRTLSENRPLFLSQKIIPFFFGAMILCWLLGLGKYTPLYHLFYSIPGMETWRNPLKFILLPGNFSLLVLSTFGATRLFESFQQKEVAPESLAHFRNLASAFVIALLFLIPFYLILTVLLPAILPIFQYSPGESGHIVGTILGSILVTLVIAGLWFGHFNLLEKSSRVRYYPLLNPWIARLRNYFFLEKNLETTWYMGLSLLVMIQMMWVHHHYFFQRPLPTVEQSSEFIQTLKSSSEPVRVKLMSRDPILDEHLNIRFPLHHISSLDIPAASRIPHDYQIFFEKMGPHVLRFSEISAVQYMIGNTSDWVQYMQDPSVKDGLGKTLFFGPGDSDENPIKQMPDPNGSLYAVTTLKNSLPRLSLIFQSEALPMEADLFLRLQDPLWHPRESVLFQDSTAPSIHSNRSTPHSLQIETYNSHIIKVAAETTESAYLLIADRFDPDWKVEINGKAGEIFRANYIERAILIPPGKSTVILTYSPSTLPTYIQLFTLLSLTLLSVRVIRSAHRCVSIPHNKP
ncbi:MAG: hypothetical protein V4507_11860 [Verrucomicrobiota bacterium]